MKGKLERAHKALTRMERAEAEQDTVFGDLREALETAGIPTNFVGGNGVKYALPPTGCRWQGTGDTVRATLPYSGESGFDEYFERLAESLEGRAAASSAAVPVIKRIIAAIRS